MDNEIHLCQDCGGGGLKHLHPLLSIILSTTSDHEFDELEELSPDELRKIAVLDRKAGIKELKATLSNHFRNKEAKQVARIFENIANKIEGDLPPNEKVKVLRNLQNTYNKYFDKKYSASILETPAGEYTDNDLCPTCKGSGYDSKRHPDRVLAHTSNKV